MKPLISVIIPTYNREIFLPGAIESVLGQTYKNIEILVCDDGSTDDTKQLVEALSKKDDRIRWISGKHSGRPAVPRNRGIKEAGGEWIAFLDDDDEWISDKLEIQISTALSKNESAVCGNAVKIKDGQEMGNYFNHNLSHQIQFSDLLFTNYIICSSALIKKEYIVDVGLFPEEQELKALEDYALWLKVSTKTPFAYISKPLVRYRDDPKNSIRKTSANSRHQKRVVIKNYLKWVITNNLMRNIKNSIHAIIKLA